MIYVIHLHVPPTSQVEEAFEENWPDRYTLSPTTVFIADPEKDPQTIAHRLGMDEEHEVIGMVIPVPSVTGLTYTDLWE